MYEIEKQLLKTSLSWPKEYLDKLVGIDHTWVPHQKSGKPGDLSLSDITKWAERMFIKLGKI
ncbi:Tn7-like element transposition protein TnsE [Photorhabdus luminescens]|uniref:Tn7-like element transposition protein TnsE n=1 Tax=Photorhabdus luminescens TaxID=29488 RepID=UPI003D2C40B5